MEITGCIAQVVALAVTVNGDVTWAPFTGAATVIPDVNFALIDADGVAHPDSASAISRQLMLSMLRARRDIRTLSKFLAPDKIRTPKVELDQG